MVGVAFYFTMMTNPAALLRMLITYAICIPLAIVMGYLLTNVGNSQTYSNVFWVVLPVALGRLGVREAHVHVDTIASPHPVEHTVERLVAGHGLIKA